MKTSFMRRACLYGAAVLAGSVLLPGLASAEELAFEGELSFYGLVQRPPDAALESMTASFLEEHPKIDIKVNSFPSENFVALLTAVQAAGEPIDILYLNGQDLRRYATNGSLEQLDPLMDNLDRFRSGALLTGQIDGNTWGVPYSDISGFPILVNTKIMDEYQFELPKTYADLLAIRDKLEGTGIAVFTHPGQNIYLWPVWFFSTFAQSSGNKSIERTADILSGNGSFTDADVVKGLDLVFQFGRDGLLTKDIFSLDIPNAQTAFTSGRALFWLNHESFASQVSEGDEPELALGVTLLPRLVEGDVSARYPGGPTGLIALGKSDNEERLQASLAFLEWITSDEADAAAVAANGGTVPVNASVAPTGGGIIQEFTDLSSNMVTYLDWNWPPEITRVFQEGIQAGVAGRKTAEEVAAEAQSTLERLIGEGYSFGN